MITVTGTVLLANGEPFQGSLLVQPVDHAPFNAGGFIIGQDFTIDTGSDGLFSQTIAAGDYEIVIRSGRRNQLKRVPIRVPNSVDGDFDATVTLEQCKKAGVSLPEYFGGLPSDGGLGGQSQDTSGLWYTTADDLRARTVHSNRQLAFLKYIETEEGGGGGWFGFDSASTDADDNADVLIPDDITHPAPGRWVRLT